MHASTNIPASQDRVLLVLATLAQWNGPVTAQQLADATGLPRSSLYRQLARLKHWGFVQEEDGSYAPGPMGLQLAQGFDASSNLVHMARMDMQRLVHQSNESVGLIVAVNDRAICLDMLESPQALRCSFEKGRSVALRKGATAKCLLAHLPAARRDALLDAWQGEPPDPQLPDRETLAAIRKAGYACSQNEIDEGVWGASAPLFGPAQRLAGCLTLMAPTSRGLARADELTQMVVIAAARVSRLLNLT
ncbi:IclR family transcriptional regulator [Bordetella genomosp. 8]|uniref:IclR family transcriptional regulator n=1 Tax=Bordetella genomosp. 8 TaxID=1416806 RepID=A0A1W6YJY9_9BORD|nr:IclR family transcriptional regulator [Bordetella genomosp. 8]ARP81358.1 IclR family transcriptional regulator [Bordetella genomosp. 8]